MDFRDIKGNIHSIQTLGTLDGPGVRFVAFLQGCNLRCGYCHNPDTWELSGGDIMTAGQLVSKAERYIPYFGSDGGITLSGGEALLQPEFAAAVFRLSGEKNIHTCLDTSGSLLNDAVKEVLSYCDYVLLDIKFTSPQDYLKYTGCSIEKPLKFLEYLEERQIPTRIRQVIITGINDDDENLMRLSEIITGHSCIESAELLAFHKLCSSKYDELRLKFPFGDYPETSDISLKTLEEKLNILTKKDMTG